MIKVSIVLPVYGVEKYLADALDSVLSQTLPEIEAICIDDASPDRCPEILDAYAAKDSRVRVLHLSENHMQGYGRNRGLEMARGEYIYFLDSDDMIVPEAMEELYEAAKKEDLDGIFFDSSYLYENEDLKKRITAHKPMREGTYRDAVCTGAELMEAFTAQNEWYVYVQREFWRREYLLENRIFNIEGIEHEDEFFSFKAALLAKRVRYIRKPWFIRRLRENSVMTRKPAPKDFHGYFITYCYMMDLIEEKKIRSSAAEELLAHMYECMGNYEEVFFAQEDPGKWFRGTPWYNAYRLYARIRGTRDLIQKNKERVFDALDRDKKVRIYGAGKIGKSVFRTLIRCGFYVSCFLVTDREGNPGEVYGIPVLTAAEAAQDPEAQTVVAMSAGYQEEVRKVLGQRRGEVYYLFRQNRLEGPFYTDEKE